MSELVHADFAYKALIPLKVKVSVTATCLIVHISGSKILSFVVTRRTYISRHPLSVAISQRFPRQ